MSQIQSIRAPDLKADFQRVVAEKFYNALKKAYETSERLKEHIDLKPSYDNYDCWLSEDGLTGAAVERHDLELCSVFSLANNGTDLLRNIINHYDFLHLNCFQGYLVDFYESFGLKVTGHDKNRHSETSPDIVLMQYHKDDSLPGLPLANSKANSCECANEP